VSLVFIFLGICERKPVSGILPNCCFTLIDVGTHGREKDSSVFSNSNFGKAFSSGDLNVLQL